MAILLFADHDNDVLFDQTARAMTAALQIGGEIDVLIVGKNAQGAAQAASHLTGVRKVLLAMTDAEPDRFNKSGRIPRSNISYSSYGTPGTA